ncbi:MAG TPA: putative lipid II flippase FtsW [Spirochaetota bacterium]|nr:putative lipid II flippase FtsW [Spirochaetota bacterium]HPC41373.1 putative lipid II flippase FtsW [Spirochaetota bacterium]HPL19227.1 putative lipid II flippase FtsW [Spirochaetota bacterium]HQF10038.1 putative lipid II flippase FtsW [Spirochaetota bacterium]HQH98633.1 putative lipid II flippase FtsW [Spirochaetota bacterium]
MDLKSFIDIRRSKEPDLVLFVVILTLTGIGIAMSYSASAVYALKVFGDPYYFLKKQILWFAIGFVFMLVFMQIDYRNYMKYTKVLLLASIAALALVLVPGIGHSAKGSVRWLGFGPVAFQPAEFVKVVVVVYLAKVFSSEAEDHFIRLLIPVIIVAVIFLMIIVQPDFGTAIDILIVSVFILFVSGFPFTYLLSLFVISIPMFYLMISLVQYRKDRVVAFLNPWAYRYGIGYHIIQSFIAFKKGGFLGVGLGNGTQKLSRLPEPHTDFIYAVIGEEAGLVGTVLIVLLFAAVLWRGIVVSTEAQDNFGRLLAVGLSLMIVVQAFINMGVVTGALPTKGIPMPFISYGGSSLLSNMIAAGILLNVSRYRGAVKQDMKLFEEVWQ